MPATYHLISSVTCPWVQRAVIAMRVKGVEFDVTYIDLKNKPDWFLEISPHGKVPVLKVDDAVLFESNAISEYLDEVVPPRLHPEDPIERARNRAWTDFLPTFGWGPGLNNLTYAADEAAMAEALETARPRVARLEGALAERGNDGPYFNGPDFSLVDAGYGPFFQRFKICDAVLKTGLLDAFPRVAAWVDALLADDKITGAVPEDFAEKFDRNLENRGALAWRRMQASAAAE